MNCLVIGGAGFIGSHLCDALHAAGDRVACVDDLSLGVKENIAHLESSERFAFYLADAGDRGSLEAVIKKEKPAYIFHLAANSDIQKSALEPELEYKNTFLTTYRVLECMRKYEIKKLFFASSSAVYGDKRDAVLDEDTPRLEPISYYGAAKLSSEALISAYAQMNSLQAVIFRFANVVGPRLTHGVILDFIKKLKTDPARLQILGDGKQEKPYLYVTDLLNALMLVKDNAVPGMNLYTIGPDSTTSVDFIARAVCREMRFQQVSFQYTGGAAGWQGDVPRYLYCSRKIQSEGWRAVYSSDEAVVEAIRANL